MIASIKVNNPLNKRRHGTRYYTKVKRITFNGEDCFELPAIGCIVPVEYFKVIKKR